MDFQVRVRGASGSRDEKDVLYLFDVPFEGFGDGLRVLRVLLGDDGQSADLIPVVLRQVFQRVREVLRHCICRGTRERASWGEGRHDFSRQGTRARH